MITLRACFPVWNEILKSKIGLEKMGNAISKGVSLNYAALTFIPLLLSKWLDTNVNIWKLLFACLAFLQIINCLFICFLKEDDLPSREFSNNSLLIGPWKDAWKILHKNSNYAHYLMMFFLGGAGLIAIQPILPLFFKDTLQLSYFQVTLAISFCKGIGFILSSPFFGKALNYISIYILNVFVNSFSCLFIFFLLSSQVNINWLFLAYFLYGIMQSGCELTWNLSGPFFSGNKVSIQYSTLNLALVGIRGLFCPIIGQLLFLNFNAQTVFVFAFILCFISLIYAFFLDRKFFNKHLFKIKGT